MYLFLILEKLKRLQRLSKKNGKTTAQLAINWLLYQKGVTTAIVGVKNPDQVEQNTGAVGWDIPGEDLETIIKYFRRKGVVDGKESEEKVYLEGVR